MKKALQLTATLALVWSVGAATAMAHDMAGMARTGAQQMMVASTYHGTGTIKALKGDKISIAHNPINALHWPAMVMDFAVKNPAMLHALKPGRKIAFDFRRAPGGSLELLSARPFQ